MATAPDTDVVALVAEAQRRGMAVPAELERELCVREMIRRGINPWQTLEQYIEYLNPSLLTYEHVPKLVQVAQQVIDGAIMRLLVLLPTRYFKTEIFSRLMSSFFLRKFPHKMVGLSSYNSSKAWEMSDQARTFFERSGGTLRPGSEAKKFWGPPEGGEFWAVGVNEGVLGRGMHLGVMDDPVSVTQAHSVVFQKRFQTFWTETWIGRQEPSRAELVETVAHDQVARLVVVMQRLGMDDPIDFLFRREVGEGMEAKPAYWHVLVMDEIKSDEPLGRWDGPQGLPKTCTLINDTRKVGDLLAPSRFSAGQVKSMQDQAGSVGGAAQRQQRPMRASGDFWKKQWFKVYDDLPDDAYNGGKDWDTAYTKEEANSATAWIESYRGKGKEGEFPIYIERVGKAWKEFPQLVAWMKELTGPHYVEEKASGKSVIQALGVYGILALPVGVHGDKFSRAAAAQPVVENSRVYINRAVYEELLLAEGQGLLRITAEALQADRGGLDVNDAFVQALHRHLGLGDLGKKKKSVQWA